MRLHRALPFVGTFTLAAFGGHVAVAAGEGDDESSTSFEILVGDDTVTVVVHLDAEPGCLDVSHVQSELTAAGHEASLITLDGTELHVLLDAASVIDVGLPPLRVLEPGEPPSETCDVPADDLGQRFPAIIDVDATCGGEDSYDLAVTITSPYDTPERYADGWQVVGPDGTVYGEHTLAHDHAAEQPFTRTQRGVEIPADVDEVVVEGRDLANGFGGHALSVALPDCPEE